MTGMMIRIWFSISMVVLCFIAIIKWIIEDPYPVLFTLILMTVLIIFVGEVIATKKALKEFVRNPPKGVLE